MRSTRRIVEACRAGCAVAETVRYRDCDFADVAQLVEHWLPKPGVVGSSPIVRFGLSARKPARKGVCGFFGFGFVSAQGHAEPPPEAVRESLSRRQTQSMIPAPSEPRESEMS